MLTQLIEKIQNDKEFQKNATVITAAIVTFGVAIVVNKALGKISGKIVNNIIEKIELAHGTPAE